MAASVGTLAERVAVLLGLDDSAYGTLYDNVEMVVAFVRAYTRGRGFPVDGTIPDDLAAVVVTAAARLVANPAGTVTEAIGDYSIRYGPAFTGWTLSELAVLHNYRRRVA